MDVANSCLQTAWTSNVYRPAARASAYVAAQLVAARAPYHRFAATGETTILRPGLCYHSKRHARNPVSSRRRIVLIRPAASGSGRYSSDADTCHGPADHGGGGSGADGANAIGGLPCGIQRETPADAADVSGAEVKTAWVRGQRPTYGVKSAISHGAPGVDPPQQGANSGKGSQRNDIAGGRSKAIPHKPISVAAHEGTDNLMMAAAAAAGAGSRKAEADGKSGRVYPDGEKQRRQRQQQRRFAAATSPPSPPRDPARDNGGSGGGGGGLLARLARGKGASLALRGGSSSSGSASRGSSSPPGSSPGVSGTEAGPSDAPSGAQTVMTADRNDRNVVSANRSTGSSSTYGGGGGGGCMGDRESAADPLVARLVRVVAYVERELLGDLEAAAAAAAVAAVHPNVPLPPPVSPAAAVQPLELFAEAPMAGRVLARAAAAAAPQREVSEPPSAHEWRLLGGALPGSAPLVMAEAADDLSVAVGRNRDAAGEAGCNDGGDGGGGDGRGGEGSSSSSSSSSFEVIVDELFRARMKEQWRYMAYLRQFVLRTGSAAVGPRRSGRGKEEGVGDGISSGSQRHQQQRREIVDDAATMASSPYSYEELRRALLDEVASASDWLQLRAVLEAAKEVGQLDSRIVAAVFKQTAGLLGGPVNAELSEIGIIGEPGMSAGRAGGGGTNEGEGYGGAPATPSAVAAFGPAETAVYSAFCNRLTAAAVASLARRDRSGTGGTGIDGNCDIGSGASGAAATSSASPRMPTPLPLPLPDKPWLRSLCDATLELLPDCSPEQMWQLLWSLARLSYVPPEDWMRSFLEGMRSGMSGFGAEALCRIAWSLAVLGYVPDRMWLRALAGQLHNRLRDLSPAQLLSLFGSLARLGYAPRPEIGSGLHAAAVRLMPLMSGEQLAALAYYAASFQRWRPGGSFLRALARAIQHRIATLMPAHASRLLWAWARSSPQQQPQRQQPQQQQLQQLLQPQQQASCAVVGANEELPPVLADALLARVLVGMRSGTVDGNDLSMALWALAVLRRPPGAEWMAAWWGSAADPRVASTFDGTCVAQSLWAAVQLRTLVGPFDEASLYSSSNEDSDGGHGDVGDDVGDAASQPSLPQPQQPLPPLSAAAAAATMATTDRAVAALLARMSGLLRSTSTANLSTTIAALADLQYRPSDAWLGLFAAEVRRRLGAENTVNEDHGLIAYGFAVLGWPLAEPWVKELAAGGYRRMAGMSGEALGMFLWGLSQYGWSTDSKRFWDTVFRETSAKWDSCSARSVVLLYCAVADLLPPDQEPPLQWQRQLAKALRLRVPRPPAAVLIPAALRAAAGGCLGPSLLRLRGPAAVAAATPGGLHVTIAATAGGGGGGTPRRRRSALDESLWSSLVYSANLYGDLGTQTGETVEGRQMAGQGVGPAGTEIAVEEEGAGEEEEVLGPEFPEEGLALETDPWDGEEGWGGDPSVWEQPEDLYGNGGEGEGEEGTDGNLPDEDYYEKLLREMYDDGMEEWDGGAAGNTGTRGAGGTAAGGSGLGSSTRKEQQQHQQQQETSASSPYIFDTRMRGPDHADPYGLLSGVGGGGSDGSRRRNAVAVRQSVLAGIRGGDDDNGDIDSAADDEPFQLPLPAELTDPEDHPALATAVSELRVWWAHDVADELRWLWGFPGALRQLPPWVRQASLARLRKMAMRRR